MDPSDPNEGQASGSDQRPTSFERFFTVELPESPEKQSSPTKQVSPAKSEKPAGGYRAVPKEVVDSIGENCEIGGEDEVKRQNTAVIFPEGDDAKDVEDASREATLAEEGIQDREGAGAGSSDGQANQAHGPKDKLPDIKVASSGLTEDENTPTQSQFAQPPTPKGPQPRTLETLPKTVYSEETYHRRTGPPLTLVGASSTSATANTTPTYGTILRNTLTTLISKHEQVTKMQKDFIKAQSDFSLAQERAAQAYRGVMSASERVLAAEEDLIRGLKLQLETLGRLEAEIASEK